MYSDLSLKRLRERRPRPADVAATAVAAGVTGVLGRKYKSPDLGDTAVLGNGHGRIVVVGPDGNLVSWNVPFAHGVPVCNDLYDGPEETSFRLGLDGVSRPGKPVFKSNSNTLVSRWRSRTGQAEEQTVVVGAPMGSDGNQVLRKITCTRGRVTAALRLRLRYGHKGEQPVKWTVLRYGAGFTEYTAMAGNTKLFFTTNMALRLSEDGASVSGTLDLEVGETAFISVGGHDSRSPRDVTEVENLFDETEDGWRRWVQSLQFRPGKYARIGVRSAINLRILGFGEGGSFYAAATRGLPEDDPLHQLAVRCWDYLKDWERDSVLSVLSLTDAGDPQVLLERYRWYRKLHDIRYKLAIMHEVDGHDVARLGEHIIDGVGYRGSLYRVGNGAGDQSQHDVAVYSAEVFYRLALQGVFDLELMTPVAEQAKAAMFKPCSGVWEIRPEKGKNGKKGKKGGAKLRVYASAQILNGQALLLFSKVFDLMGETDKAREFAALAAQVMPWVRRECVSNGVIVAAPDMPVLDSSILLAFIMAPDMFEPSDKPLVAATAFAIDMPHTTPGPIQGLRVGKGHRRYNAGQFNDGISMEEEGLFTNVTGWLAIVFLQLGMTSHAETLMGELMASFNRVEQAAEEKTPEGRALGNLNQAYVYQAVIWFVLLYQAIMAEQEEARAAEAALV
ncbi:glycoside hydrolase family 15 protein [Actinomadura luteofluorescens]|uniref:glycoside hydrolase family 15 protein n=1 Tax=Actinomadura luteofluorescens TaxID=46163 RepID=UPI003D91E617